MDVDPGRDGLGDGIYHEQRWWKRRDIRPVGRPSKGPKASYKTSSKIASFENIARVRNRPDVTILNSLFGLCLFAFLLFCLYVFLSFLSCCLVVFFALLSFIMLSFCLDIMHMKCLKGLKAQKSLFVSKF